MKARAGGGRGGWGDWGVRAGGGRGGWGTGGLGLW